MPPFKELHYFDELSRIPSVASARARDDRDRMFLESIKRLSARSHLDLDHYAQLFAAKGRLLSGDITPAYSMLNDEVIERIDPHVSRRQSRKAQRPIEARAQRQWHEGKTPADEQSVLSRRPLF